MLRPQSICVYLIVGYKWRGYPGEKGCCSQRYQVGARSKEDQCECIKGNHCACSFQANNSSKDSTTVKDISGDKEISEILAQHSVSFFCVNVYCASLVTG